ncbi:MAG: hypothetical protein JSS72_00365 [Armatimonadetes bacterium]|nr:hypothetical protein [Armatimonadota bacterium]
MFLSLLLFGASGIVLLSILGFVHMPGAHHGSGHSGSLHTGHGHTSALPHAGHGHAASVPHGGHGHAAPAPHGGHGHAHGPQSHGIKFSKPAGGASGVLKSLLIGFLSPVQIFGFCVGFGFIGVILQPILAGPLLIGLAIIAGLLFDFALLPMIMNLVIGFTRPSEGLEAAVATLATAESGFDAKGQGIISVEIDGARRELLALLPPSELPTARTISKGDKLLILEVDAKRNRCTVSTETVSS